MSASVFTALFSVKAPAGNEQRSPCMPVTQTVPRSIKVCDIYWGKEIHNQSLEMLVPHLIFTQLNQIDLAPV